MTAAVIPAAVDLLDGLRGRGYSVRVERGNVVVAPTRGIGPKLHAALAARRVELLALLAAEDAPKPAAPAAAEKDRGFPSDFPAIPGIRPDASGQEGLEFSFQNVAKGCTERALPTPRPCWLCGNRSWWAEPGYPELRVCRACHPPVVEVPPIKGREKGENS